MRKVIGIGEIILDIIFKDGQPCMAIPGGSVFNAMVSLSRLGIPVSFIGEVGEDPVGKMITEFMQANHMTTEHIDFFPDRNTPVSLALLDETNNAEFMFYTNKTVAQQNNSIPVINQDDILIFGSYYAVNPYLREYIVELLEYAKARKAIIYYDPNFRKAHIHEVIHVRPSVIENFEYADIVRGSNDDFLNLFNSTDMEQIFKEEIQFYCQNFITTHGSEGVNLYTETQRSNYHVPSITPVSTIGAGDNFNAGFIYGLFKCNIGFHDLTSIDESTWNKIVGCGIDLSTEVCRSYSNYISPEFANKYTLS